MEGGKGSQEVDRGLRNLYRAGLLAELEGGPGMHPLLAAFARRQETAGEERVLARVAEGILALAVPAIESGLPERFKPLRAHVRAAAGAAEQAGLEAAGLLWNVLGYHLRRVAENEEAMAEHERALRLTEQVYRAEHPNVAAAANNLGMALQDLGDYEGARAAYERALAIGEQALGAEHPLVATYANNLGLVLKDLGDYQGAKENYERALRILVKGLPEGHPNIRKARRNLEKLLERMEKGEGAGGEGER